jgi:hypothetical protein
MIAKSLRDPGWILDQDLVIPEQLLSELLPLLLSPLPRLRFQLVQALLIIQLPP